MKHFLAVLLVAAASGLLPRCCSAQYMYPQMFQTQPVYGQQPVYRQPQPMYQPRLTSMTVFQDGGVPIPADPGNPVANPTNTRAPQADPAVSAPIAPADTGVVMPFTESTGEACCGAPAVTPMFQEGQTWNAFSPPLNGDPFLNTAPMQSPAQPNVPPGTYSYGANAPAPYRFGWQNSIDLSWLPSAELSTPTVSELGIFGLNYKMSHTVQLPTSWIFRWTNQFNYRNLTGGGSLDLPSSLFRVGIDLEWETPASAPVGLSLGINPSINTDFAGNVWGDGFQLDGRGMLLFRMDQYWMLGLGALYWDRVEDRVLPYGGLIYRDDYWEWQLTYPEAQVSLFLGNEAYWSKWIYFRAEYHVEAYGIERTVAGVAQENQIEISDYRLVGGFRMDTGLYSWFLEGGYVMDRNLVFATGQQDLKIGDGFIGQIGLRY